MKLGLWLGLALATAVALPAVGCLGAPFGTTTGTGGSGGTGGATSSSSSGTGGDSCVPPTQNCNNNCVDIEVDTSNCGACGNHCKPGQVCEAGDCHCPADKPDTCNDVCTNKQTDATNCGTCGNACPDGGGCNAGQCGECNGTVCNGVCVDTKTDHDNCGSCGHHCGPDALCSNGLCACDGGKEYCGDVDGCLDVMSDPAHCGSCDNDCTPGDSCENGVCMCPGGGVDCGSGTCAVVAYSPTDCGTCGVACNSDQACINGTCGCRPPLMQTVNGCVDPGHDPAHCGLMNVACDATKPVCAPAVGCVTATMCANNNGTVCDGGCYLPAELKANPFHCGQCGNACAADEACVNGTCVGFTVVPACGSSNCPTGSTCCTYPVQGGSVQLCVEAASCPMVPMP